MTDGHCSFQQTLLKLEQIVRFSHEQSSSAGYDTIVARCVQQQDDVRGDKYVMCYVWGGGFVVSRFPWVHVCPQTTNSDWYHLTHCK